VGDSRNIAPSGWHVPTDDDWKKLEMYLGLNLSQANSTAWRGTDEGGKMKATGTIEGGDGLWNTPNTGATNLSGFTALPGGSRHSYNGAFLGLGSNAYFWSSTEYDSDFAWYRYLFFNHSDVGRFNYSKRDGLSVRCLRD
jgi:uncharacterized protein (TIGR02145 family)